MGVVLIIDEVGPNKKGPKLEESSFLKITLNDCEVGLDLNKKDV